MNDRPRRILSTAVAILIALSSVLVCAPVPAEGAQEHCKPAKSTRSDSSHCLPKDALDCCVTSAPQPSSAPENSQTQGTARVSALIPLPGTAANASSVHVPDLSRALREAPAHGFRFTDLPVLNATFLI